jgi:hypothetical protein
MAVVASACSSPNGPPSRGSFTPSRFQTPKVSTTPTQLPEGAGWKVVVQAIDHSPGRAGYDNLDATLLLQWGGPELGTAPNLGASVTSSNGRTIALQATVFGESPVLVPVGFAVPAEVIGEWPTALPAPQLRIFTTGSTPFHEASVPLNVPFPVSSPLPLPPADPGAVLEVSGQVRVTPSLLTVAHWNSGDATVFVRHGNRSIEYGNSGDFWQVSVGVTVQNLGSVELPFSQLSFELFDDTWGESAPDVLLDPRQGADSVPPGASRSAALSFESDQEPAGLRLLSVISDAAGTPIASGVAGFDRGAVSAGKQTFQDLLAALDHFQATCATTLREDTSVPATIGTSSVDFAGASDPHGALIRTSDGYRGTKGEQLGSAQNTYVLARDTGPWQVQFTTASPSGQAGQC